MTNWWSLPPKVKLYISTIVVIAIPVSYRAFTVVFSGNQDYYWLILTVITLGTLPFSVSHPGARRGVTVGDAFVISICMMYSIETAVVANILYIAGLALVLKRKHGTPAHRIIFNIATASINVQIYGTLFYWLNSHFLLNPINKVLLPTFCIAIAFFLSNSVLIAIALSLSSNGRLFEVWRENCAPMARDFLVSAVAGKFIVLFKVFGPFYPILVAPCVLVVWGINDYYRANQNAQKQLIEDAQKHLEEQEQLYLRTVETLALAVDAKDQTTYGHIRRVRAYALGLAQISGITEPDEIKAIETGSLLHDIGKLAIEDYLLNKPGRLTKEEFEKMKLHATAGDEILQIVEFPFPVARYVRCHHERWDGSGYPDGLKGEEIPVGARILAIADAFDAIRSTRPYKSAFGVDDSVELLRSQAGTNYDPRLVELFISHIDELEVAADEAARNRSELSFRKYFEKVDSAISNASASPVVQSLPTAESEELVRLFEFCVSTGPILGLSDALPILARRLRRIVPYHTCAFYLYQDDDSVKAEYACGEYSESMQGLRIGLGKGISGWVAAYKRPMINTDAALEFQGVEGDHAQLQCALVVPLVQDTDCLGTISLYSLAPESYSQTHLSLLQIVAEQVAPLVAEARMSGMSENQSLLDPVTGTHRVAYLSVAGAQILAHAAKTDAPLSLLYIEIKNFSKSVALYGMGTGDLILARVAEILRSELRQTDVLVRFGPHGFVALLPGVRGAQAARYIHRVQHMIKSTPLNLAPGTTFFVNCQAGIASYPNDGSTLLPLLHAAQRSLTEQARLAGPQAQGSEGNVLEFPPRA